MKIIIPIIIKERTKLETMVGVRFIPAEIPLCLRSVKNPVDSFQGKRYARW